MPTYTYEAVLVPPEAAEKARQRQKAVRISYWKMFGDEPPGWLVGTGYLDGNRFILEEEFITREIVVKTQTFGFIAFQKPMQGDIVDRGWILTFCEKIEYDGRRCVIS
ncbi:MAG: hypothetical protein NZ921_02985 [Candidatus Caldarchaeum sp.]|nr:hypothetical protein [Candidatus Caldarchaeum sp.]MCS7133745.1 hypothetical protein [Candidatus Caldarchaeum sp.]MCX8201663.1 hypothetical protein [Candidatus Caldarchaeum sp.]MDW8434966.1 hypothetical protein [Candidatus Caldarchaeum sp.]